ncbi:uncharacterized protein LOC107748440 [Sinocyclocheilus rhinocerous]|uniref:uncharacterized protein LOC107748440 n=1 Tax=Sinocyclocheilus rhinocerous TaxID=307959 RepID=UPI0007B9AF76|nr:PREDICTED: uncharacterized protein LOC107748440 [Sinocyclocheilus rhinocerous]
MKVKLNSDVDSQTQSCSNSDEEGTNSLCDNHFIVVKLEDEDPETEMDLSIFAPVESSECEDEDELSDSSGASIWRKKSIRERDNQEDSASLEKVASSRSLKGRRKSRQTFLAEQRHNQSLECSAANRDMNVGLPSEDHTFHRAVPPSDSARGPAEMSELDTAISPLAAMEPPVFPNAPVQSKSVVGEDQQNILLEVLNHCRFLHSAVQRLEQKIDRQMSNESSYERSSAKLKNGPKRDAEDRQLSWSLSQQLDPPVQRNPRWIPPWKRGLDRADLQQADNSSLQSGKPPGGGRGRGRGRGRRGRSSRSQRQSQTPDPASLVSKPNGDEIRTASTDDPQVCQVMKNGSQANTGSKRQQKRKKTLAQVDEEKIELEKMPNNKEATLEVQVDNKVMIGSPLRKVWILLSVYKEVFKAVEPQKAVVPVLHALFPISTLSCSAVTGNPAKGIQQLDPNKIEALREFLAEMYPQFDVGVRGVSWAQCLGVINNVTKDLKKKAEKTSHLPTEVCDTRSDCSYSGGSDTRTLCNMTC